MVNAMLDYKGVTGRPNAITRWYAERHGAAFLSAAWCDMTVTKAAHDSNNVAAVLPGGDRAYTVWHAQDFQKIGRWYPGTKANVDRAKAGDIVFFDWGGTDGIGYIDHVGVVIRALGGGYLETVEGNTGDAVAVKKRHYSVIAGYGRPAYGGSAPAQKPASKPKSSTSTYPKWPGRYLTQPPMMYGNDVRTWQMRMVARGWRLSADGWYGPESEKVCRAFQKEKGLAVDGVVGPKTWAAAWTAPIT